MSFNLDHTVLVVVLDDLDHFIDDPLGCAVVGGEGEVQEGEMCESMGQDVAFGLDGVDGLVALEVEDLVVLDGDFGDEAEDERRDGDLEEGRQPVVPPDAHVPVVEHPDLLPQRHDARVLPLPRTRQLRLL